MQNEEEGDAALGGEMPWNAMLAQLEQIKIRQGTIAGHGRTAGVLTRCCDNDDDCKSKAQTTFMVNKFKLSQIFNSFGRLLNKAAVVS